MQPNEKVQNLSYMLGTFLPDDMGIFLQQDSINDFNYFHPGASYTIQTSDNRVSDLERWS